MKYLERKRICLFAVLFNVLRTEEAFLSQDLFIPLVSWKVTKVMQTQITCLNLLLYSLHPEFLILNLRWEVRKLFNYCQKEVMLRNLYWVYRAQLYTQTKPLYYYKWDLPCLTSPIEGTLLLSAEWGKDIVSSGWIWWSWRTFLY